MTGKELSCDQCGGTWERPRALNPWQRCKNSCHNKEKWEALKELALRACLAKLQETPLSAGLLDKMRELTASEMLKGARKDIARFRYALTRLASSEALENARMLDPSKDAELISRIDYARAVLAREDETDG